MLDRGVEAPYQLLYQGERPSPTAGHFDLSLESGRSYLFENRSDGSANSGMILALRDKSHG